MNLGQINGIGGTGAAAYAQQTNGPREAAAVESTRQTRQQQTEQVQKRAPLPLAASGTLGTQVNVTA